MNMCTPNAPCVKYYGFKCLHRTILLCHPSYGIWFQSLSFVFIVAEKLACKISFTFVYVTWIWRWKAAKFTVEYYDNSIAMFAMVWICRMLHKFLTTSIQTKWVLVVFLPHFFSVLFSMSASLAWKVTTLRFNHIITRDIANHINICSTHCDWLLLIWFLFVVLWKIFQRRVSCHRYAVFCRTF